MTPPFMQRNIRIDAFKEADKSACLDQLKKATETDLWTMFLEGQTQLFFDSEWNWMVKGAWWQSAKNVLETGSGSGSYLSALSHRVPEKIFRGMEKRTQAVQEANDRHASTHVTFREGDAETFYKELRNSADLILFRLTLQHLEHPELALRYAAEYLHPRGHLVLIESYDPAMRTSHPIPSVEEALLAVAEVQARAGRGNRQVTLPLLQGLVSGLSPLRDVYEVVSSNLDLQGDVVGDRVWLEGDKSRMLFPRHCLLFLELMRRTYAIPVDLSRAYDELREYANDEAAWTSPGMHFLVLKKAAP